jgi:glycosyltransferase involved in cell wall biosynthesis
MTNIGLPANTQTVSDLTLSFPDSRVSNGTAAPLVSIGLPVRNGGQFLEETLKSICAQTFADFEVIISDNASTDQTREICESYVARDPRIYYHRLDENLGAAPNYNRVFALARGKYFKWAAHDDLLKPAFLQSCLDEMERSPETVVVYTRTEIIDECGAFVRMDDLTLVVDSRKASRRLKNFYRRIRLANPIFGLIRADALRKTRLIDSFISSDLVLLAELLMLGEFKEHPDPLFQRRWHAGCSVRANPKAQDRQNWFDTKKTVSNAWIPFEFRFSWEYSRSVCRMPLPWTQRAVCMLVTLRWKWWPALLAFIRRRLNLRNRSQKTRHMTAGQH